MWIELFLCLLLAHLVADFALQTNNICTDKKKKKWRSPYHYWHSVVVFALSWLAAFDLRFWWCAAIIGALHFFIDMWKSYREEKIEWFVIDQLAHILILTGISFLWCKQYDWSIPFAIAPRYVALAVAIVACWKPANIFIKLTLKHYSVNMPNEKGKSDFNAGTLIGNLERWLILIFVLLHHYEALGLLVAAKSIIRFRDKETTKTEYVLAGTLLSILIAVVLGLIVLLF